MSSDSNDPRKKTKTPENRSDSFTENAGDYRGFKAQGSASFTSRRSYHQERPMDRNDSSNSQIRRNSSDISGMGDLLDLNDKSFHEICTKKAGEISRSNSGVDLMEALEEAIGEIRSENRPGRAYREPPKTAEEFQIELERVQKEMIEVSFNIKYGSNPTALSELKWGSPIKASGDYRKPEPERRSEQSFVKKKPCYMPDSPPCVSSRTKSMVMQASHYDIPDSPSAGISTESFYGLHDRASKRKAKDQITNYAVAIDAQSDEDNESVKDGFTEVHPKKRKNNKGKNKNTQNKPPAKKIDMNKNQRKLFESKRDNSSLVDISMEEDPAKGIVEVTDDEEEDMFTSRKGKSMSLTKRVGAAKDFLQNPEKSLLDQTRDDEAMARQLGEKEKEKDMEADAASRSSSTPQRFRKVVPKSKEEQVSCPICDKKFAKSKIETHAADCQGAD